MENQRSNAYGWLYERCELHGTELWATGAALDHSTVPKGFHCYDLYTDKEPSEADARDIFIARNPVKNPNAGAVLTAEPLPFHEKDAISLRGVHLFEDEYLQPLKAITGETQQAEAPQQEHSMQTQEL